MGLPIEGSCENADANGLLSIWVPSGALNDISKGAKTGEISLRVGECQRGWLRHMIFSGQSGTETRLVNAFYPPRLEGVHDLMPHWVSVWSHSSDSSGQDIHSTEPNLY